MTMLTVTPSGRAEWARPTSDMWVPDALLIELGEEVNGYTTSSDVWVFEAQIPARHRRRNPVAGAMAMLLGGAWVPYSGNVVFTGRAEWRRDPVRLNAERERALRRMHADVCRVLELPYGDDSLRNGPQPLAAEIRRAADYVRTAHGVG